MNTSSKRTLSRLAVLVLLLGLLLPLTFAGHASAAGPAPAEGPRQWYRQDSGLPETLSLRGVAAISSRTAWAVGDGGTILKTTNGGINWVHQDSGTTTNFWDVAFAPDDPDCAWVVGQNGMIVNTNDGGATWATQNSGESTNLISVSAADSYHVWAVGAGDIIVKTNNGGSTWARQFGYATGNLDGVSAANRDTAWAVGGYTDGTNLHRIIYKTSDGGTNWNLQSHVLDRPAWGVHAYDTNLVWVVGCNGLLQKSVDGGDNWVIMDSGINNFWLFGIATPTAETALVVGDHGTILKTDNGGNDWRFQDSGVNSALWDVSAASPSIAWAVGDHGTILNTTPRFNWYFAEGSTRAGFQEYLCLTNFGLRDATAKVTYMYNGTDQDASYVVPAQSRLTVDVNAAVGPDRDVSALIRPDALDMVAERSMYFSYNGVHYQGVWTGGTAVIGANVPSSTQYFAEGFTGPSFDEYLTILNPGGAQADLTFSFQTQEAGLITRTGSVPARSRATFDVNALLGMNFQHSTKIEATQPIVAERPMYFDYIGVGNAHWNGGHCVMGAPSLSSQYYFAEGTTRGWFWWPAHWGFEEWLTLQNPNDSTITVTAEYQLGPGQGGPITKTYSIGAGRRYTAYAPFEVGIGKDVSVKVTSDSTFFAERPMYFSYQGFGGLNWVGGSCVIGSFAPASEWMFAEGNTNRNGSTGFDEWLTLQNPFNADSHVEITYLSESGVLPVKTVTVPAHKRATVCVNYDNHPQFPGGAGPNHTLSCRVAVVDGPDIVAERPMYFKFESGLDGGHDTVGYQDVCIDNQRSIDTAIAMYYTDFNRNPDNLQELVQNGYLLEKCLHCPQGGTYTLMPGQHSYDLCHPSCSVHGYYRDYL